MFMSTLIPALSGEGWIRDTKAKMRTMFAHALVSDHSQSTIYETNITSLNYTIAQYNDNKESMASAMAASLTEYYSRVFSNVDVIVTTEDVDDRQYKLFITIDVKEDGNSYSLATVNDVKDSVLSLTLKEINI
jgi:hypothetical protein